jgi:hypothetical protein
MCKCFVWACGLVHHQRVQRLRHHLRPCLSSQLKGLFGRAATWLRDFEGDVCIEIVPNDEHVCVVGPVPSFAISV